jgi:NADH-quinone oxidoreductase subunit E
MNSTVLSANVCAKIDEWIKRYPPERKASGILQALHYVQEENQGSLTVELMDAVADYLEMTRTQVYEVATFYSLFHLKPIGRHVVSVCSSISCWLKGSEKILEHFENKLKIAPGETTADGKFSLFEVECLGACIGAPMCRVNKEYHEDLTPESVDKILETLK